MVYGVVVGMVATIGDDAVALRVGRGRRGAYARLARSVEEGVGTEKEGKSLGMVFVECRSRGLVLDHHIRANRAKGKEQGEAEIQKCYWPELLNCPK